MEVGAARAYWGIVAGRAKLARRAPAAQWYRGEVALLALDPEAVIVGIPATTCLSTVQAIRAQSPFPYTLVWDGLGPSTLGHIVPEAEGALGGVHRATRDFSQEAIDAMVVKITQGLRSLHIAVQGQIDSVHGVHP